MTKLTVISLYSGMGGMDFGFQAAGFGTAICVEQDPVCCHIIRTNRKWKVLEGDINSFSSRKILANAKLRKGEADVLIAGPPCQPFSKSSYWANGDSKRLDDPRADTLTSFLRVLRDIQPRTFVLENVKGFAYRGKESGLDHVLNGVKEINETCKTNYKVCWKVLNAADYGVPQLRERIFLVASRDGRNFEFPEPTHGEGYGEPFRTAWDAIGDLPANPNDPSLALRGKWAKLLKSIPEGKNYLHHTPYGQGKALFGWRTRYWNFMLKLAKSQPSWTLQSTPGPSTGPFHWRNRLLSVQEMARLQTLPDNLKYNTSYRNVQRMIGNAVPSLVAEIIGTAVRNQLLDRTRKFKQYKFLRPRLKTTPKRERVYPVDKSFLPLIDDHPDHAGVGMGPRALQRLCKYEHQNGLARE